MTGCRTLSGQWIDLVTPKDLEEHAVWASETRKVVEWFSKKIPGSYTETTLASVAWYWDSAQIDIGQQYVSSGQERNFNSHRHENYSFIFGPVHLHTLNHRGVSKST